MSFVRTLAICVFVGSIATGCRTHKGQQADMKDAMDLQPPFETIRKEHKIIRQVAQAARSDARDIRRTGSADRERVGQYIDFFSGFNDACHHRKEELYLFPAVQWHDRQGDLIRSLREDHTRGRELVSRMRQAVPEDGPVDATALSDAMESYAEMLFDHIRRENEQLLPAAEKTLDRAERVRVAEGYVYVEHELLGEGFHEKYHEMAQKLISP